MIMIKRTKIVATLSVQRCTEELVRSLFKAGMNIVRINSAHASLENAAEIIRMVRSVSNSIPVMLDTKGPEIRVTRMDDAYPDGIRFAAGDRVKVRGTSVKTDIPSTREVIYMNVEHIVRDVPAGATMLIADGEMELHVEQKSAEELVCLLNATTTVSGSGPLPDAGAQLRACFVSYGPVSISQQSGQGGGWALTARATANVVDPASR